MADKKGTIYGEAEVLTFGGGATITKIAFKSSDTRYGVLTIKNKNSVVLDNFKTKEEAIERATSNGILKPSELKEPSEFAKSLVEATFKKDGLELTGGQTHVNMSVVQSRGIGDTKEKPTGE